MYLKTLFINLSVIPHHPLYSHSFVPTNRDVGWAKPPARKEGHTNIFMNLKFLPQFGGGAKIILLSFVFGIARAIGYYY